MPLGLFYMINGLTVPMPDEDRWPLVVIGEGLDSLQRRSPYRKHEWEKRVAEEELCRISWDDYDNTVLTSLTTRAQGRKNEYNTYTDAICQSVVARHRRGNMVDVVATFLVNLESATL